MSPTTITLLFLAFAIISFILEKIPLGLTVEQQIKSLGDRRIATNYNPVFSILVC